ncbi:Type II secretion system protein D precursor [Rubripirellula tenax]|uniref:Type II secretion system protein D n=1 Tax=Rubripirellula tenax TaxID=2528015 RepID=A0A5C6F494_9BACT|nr:secretin N-terminal domain-containing protein [Rubripirellula tenax]TWU56563.1 Type II secretion system protein D precursor [Rubripirellula tenax]
MDGNDNQNSSKRFRNVAAWCAHLVAASSFATITFAQSPLPMDPTPSARPIYQAEWPVPATTKLVRPPARLVSGKDSPFTATLTGASTDSARQSDPQPGAWNPVDETTESASTQNTTSDATSLRTVEDALQTRGSITFRKTPLSEVVFLLSDLWRINIVAGADVSGEVSGSFHDAPLSEVLAAALTSSGYSYRKTGSSLVVLPADQIGVNDPSFVSETLSLPPSLRDDESTIEAAQLMLSERGQLKKIGADLILVIDRPERIQRIRDLFLSLSSGNPLGNAATNPDTTRISTSAPQSAVNLAGIAYFTPQFTEASEMAVPLQITLGTSVNVSVYPQENRIMVKGSPSELQMASEIIAQLDKPRQQVRITAMIYDVGLTELEKLGVNWSRDVRALANGANELLEGVTTPVNEFYKFTSDLTTTGATSLGIRTITGNLEANVFLEALDSSSEAKLLADPSITVGDRRQASIRIVRKIPIVGANPVNGSNAVFTQTEFEEAGVILNVEPRISRDGTIELKVQPEYSVVAEITSTGPVIDSRTAETYVRVGDGQTFVLGGLRQKSIVESQRGVPYLRDIKYIGGLFRSHDTEVRESELIVFLKPEIITPYDKGSPRQQMAACVANTQLDLIPHADVCPQTPCCKDPHCPNHHPRPRINGGSMGLPMMIGGSGFNEEVFQDTTLETSNTLHIETPAEVLPSPVTPHAVSTEDFYPPVIVDPRMMN